MCKGLVLLIKWVLDLMIGFIGTSLQLQSIMAVHNQWLSTTRSIPYWTTSVFSSAVTNHKRRIPAHTLNCLERRLSEESRNNLSLISDCLECRVQSYVTTDVQSVSLSWNKAPFWGLRPDFYYCQTVAGLLMLGALTDERTGLSFTTVAGSRQRSHSPVRIPWDSRPYFTVSDSKLSFSSPPTTRRATVEVFDTASTRDSLSQSVIFTTLINFRPNA
jgi:hypothetical protein